MANEIAERAEALTLRALRDRGARVGLIVEDAEEGRYTIRHRNSQVCWFMADLPEVAAEIEAWEQKRRAG